MAKLPTDVVRFLRGLASSETEAEINDRTDGRGMSGDHAVSEYSGAIESARQLLEKHGYKLPRVVKDDAAT